MRQEDGVIVRDVLKIKSGDMIKTILGKGAFISRVEEIFKD